ncbi:MAG: preprotein translocase subunit YajC [Segniliparus sp.]|uniref:preprotein translocase subunit YajC n=1 Tax=Segniliparus sp. TaxID=2804064 RepID=UPI003F3545AA
MLPLIGLGALMFLVLWWQGRARSKAMAQVQSFQDSLVEGDRVVTTSGLHGSVREVRDQTILLEIAPGVVTEWTKLAVREKAEEPEQAEPELDAAPSAPAEASGADHA